MKKILLTSIIGLMTLMPNMANAASFDNSWYQADNNELLFNPKSGESGKEEAECKQHMNVILDRLDDFVNFNKNPVDSGVFRSCVDNYADYKFIDEVEKHVISSFCCYDGVPDNWMDRVTSVLTVNAEFYFEQDVVDLLGQVYNKVTQNCNTASDARAKFRAAEDKFDKCFASFSLDNWLTGKCVSDDCDLSDLGLVSVDKCDTITRYINEINQVVTHIRALQNPTNGCDIQRLKDIQKVYELDTINSAIATIEDYNQKKQSDEAAKVQNEEYCKGDIRATKVIIEKYQSALTKVLDGLDGAEADVAAATEKWNIVMWGNDCFDEEKQLQEQSKYYKNLYAVATGSETALMEYSGEKWSRHDEVVNLATQAAAGQTNDGDGSAKEGQINAAGAGDIISIYQGVLDKYLTGDLLGAVDAFNAQTEVPDQTAQPEAYYYYMLAKVVAEDKFEEILPTITKLDSDTKYYERLNAVLSGIIDAQIINTKTGLLSGESVRAAALKNPKIYNSGFVFMAQERGLDKERTLQSLGQACLDYAENDNTVSADDCIKFMSDVMDAQ